MSANVYDIYSYLKKEGLSKPRIEVSRESNIIEKDHSSWQVNFQDCQGSEVRFVDGEAFITKEAIWSQVHLNPSDYNTAT